MLLQLLDIWQPLQVLQRPERCQKIGVQVGRFHLPCQAVVTKWPELLEQCWGLLLLEGSHMRLWLMSKDMLQGVAENCQIDPEGICQQWRAGWGFAHAG